MSEQPTAAQIAKFSPVGDVNAGYTIFAAVPDGTTLNGRPGYCVAGWDESRDQYVTWHMCWECHILHTDVLGARCRTVWTKEYYWGHYDVDGVISQNTALVNMLERIGLLPENAPLKLTDPKPGCYAITSPFESMTEVVEVGNAGWVELRQNDKNTNEKDTVLLTHTEAHTLRDVLNGDVEPLADWEWELLDME